MITHKTCKCCGLRRSTIFHTRLRVHICHACITDCNLEGHKIEREFTDAAFKGVVLK